MDWLPVYIRVWSNAWVLSLKMPHRFLWLYLITNNDYGFVEYVPLLWQLQTGIEQDAIEAGLNRIEADGRIAREGNMICVLNALQYRKLRGNNLIGAIADIRERYGKRYPSLVSAILGQKITVSTNSPETASSEEITPETGCESATQPTGLEPGSNPVLLEREREKERKTKAPASAGTSAKAEPKPHPPRITKPAKLREPADPGYTPEELALAGRMDADIARLKEQGFNIGRNWRRRPEQIATSLHASGVQTADAGRAWDWAMGNAHWSSQVVNQASFTAEPNRWVELVNQWRARTRPTQPGSAAGDGDLPSVEEAVAPQSVAVSPAFAQANSIPMLDEFDLDDVPTPEVP